MNKNIQKICLIAFMLLVITVMMSTLMAQPVPTSNGPIGSQIAIGMNENVLYWNGSAWIVIPSGLPGQTLLFTNGVPAWVNNTNGITTNAVTNINSTTAICGGHISSSSGSPITARGVCWSTSHNPTLSNSFTTDDIGKGSFTSTLTGLNLDTTYYIRAYATNSAGTVYGNELSFICKRGIGDSYQGGIIAYILQPGDSGYDANIQKGLIAAPYDQGGVEWGYYGESITGAYGTAIGTGKQNTIAIINYGKQEGIAAKLCFDLNLGGYSDWYLPSIEELNQIYINRVAIGGLNGGCYWCSTESGALTTMIQYFYEWYGDQQYIYYNDYKFHPYSVRAVRSFPNSNTLAALTTSTINNITDTTAICGGNISSNGGAIITASGLCWSTTPNPTIIDSFSVSNVVSGGFISNLTNLIPGTTYYVRAFAANSEGTAYGDQVSFATTGIKPLYIGQPHQGGIIAYLFKPGDNGYVENVQHGLIAAPYDQNTSQWYNGLNITTNATGAGIGTGNANTDSITTYQGIGEYAAKICSDLTLNGYNDWYLPSIEELNKLFINRIAIGGFVNDYYWSSTENSDNTYAWIQWFYNGYQVIDVKTSAYPIRAVRTF